MNWEYHDLNYYACLQVRAIADDGARLVLNAVGVHDGQTITHARKRYYCHGPRGVTDWHSTEDEAIAAYEALGE